MNKQILLLLTLLLISNTLWSQDFSNDPMANTYSIIARDSVTGEMGVAVQSHAFSTGTAVTWGEAGVGVIATQSLVNRSFGPNGLKLLKEGKSPEEVVKTLTEADSGRDWRQLGVLDMQGRSASYTGKKCIADAGNIAENNFSVQANMMLNDKVVPAMAIAFKKTKGTLAERMMASMEAAQHAGGDIRGMQSAAMLIVKPVSTGRIWEDRTIDLRVDDNPNPIKELKRLLKIVLAYEHMDACEAALGKNDFVTAAKEYEIAESISPQDIERKFWYAVELVNKDKVTVALPYFKIAFKANNNWALLIPRLRKAELLTCDDKTEKIILNMQHK